MCNADTVPDENRDRQIKMRCYSEKMHTKNTFSAPKQYLYYVFMSSIAILLRDLRIL